MHNEYLPLSNPRLGVAKEIIEVALCGAQWWVCACGVHPSYGLPLGAIIQSYSLSYPALSAACLPIYFPACTYVPYTRHGVPPSRYNKLEQVTFAATAAYTHCVPVVAHACCFIHKPIETYGGIGATRRCKGSPASGERVNDANVVKGTISVTCSVCLDSLNLCMQVKAKVFYFDGILLVVYVNGIFTFTSK